MGTSANLAQGINSAGNAYVQAQATRAQGDYQKRISEINARSAEAQAEDVLKRGENEAQKKLQETRKFIGQQKTAMAASGTDVNSQGALDLTADTAAIGATDVMTIKNNAWREAMGYKSQAIEVRGSGEMAQMAAKNNARSTMITGGIDALSYGIKAADSKSSKKAKR